MSPGTYEVTHSEEGSAAPSQTRSGSRPAPGRPELFPSTGARLLTRPLTAHVVDDMCGDTEEVHTRPASAPCSTAAVEGFVIEGAVLADLAAGERYEGSSVRVEGDRIVDVGVDGERMAAGDDVRRLDAGGRTLMPGLIDAHVHAAITKMDIGSMNHRPLTRIGIEAKAILEGMLRRGFTTIRDAGGMDRGLKDAAEAGLISAPRIFRSGRVLSQTGGHGDTAAPSNHPRLCACGIDTTGFAHVADGPDAVRRAAREELKGGADQIKVMAGGGVASPNDPIDMTQYTEAELQAAVAEAAARRTYVMAHA